jgi:two-component system chemotaxis response regulator CheB
MLSHFTREGARATLDALDAGALDFLAKRMEEISGNHQESIRLIRKRIRALGLNGRMPAPTAKVLSSLASPAPRNPSAYAIEPYSSEPQSIEPHSTEQGRTRFCPEDFKLLAIAASTGGPVALQRILTRLPENFPLPILLIQHMPGSFTSAYAQRLDQQCAIQVKEAEHGDILRAGSAYLAPGGRQVELRTRGEHVCIHLVEAKPEEHYKPSVDIAFRSAAGVFPAETMAIVLTGMGADGCEGARLLKQGGSTIWAQDKASSVIYGMPRAVAKAGLVDQVLSLDDIGGALSLAC